MDDDTFTSIPIAGWPGLTVVRLYDSTMSHIAEHAEFRLELPSQREGLEIGIANPAAIHVSLTDPRGSVVVVSEAFTYFTDPLVVPVRLLEGTTSGRVTTAYFSSATYGGTVLWKLGNE